MSSRSISLTIVLPTRNRADLAIRACRSLLEQPGAAHVFVSDNSTDAQHVRQLRDYCATADRARLSYVRPSEMTLPAHWNWALTSAMDATPATHFALHYDRRVTKPGELRRLELVAADFPDDLISYPLDLVLTESGRSRVGQAPWTGRVYEVRTARIAELAAQARIAEIGQVLPFLSNCIVPRAALEAVRRTFADICDSTGPDSCFAFRFCATHDRLLHYDRAPGIVYASGRSTGLGYLKGSGGDFDDFMRTWRDRSWLESAPIPGVTLGLNMLFHEYERVRVATGHPAFRPLDKPGYLRDLAGGLRLVDNAARAAALREILVQHGWRPSPRFHPLVFGAERVLRRSFVAAAARGLRQAVRTVAARVRGGSTTDLSGLHFADEDAALQRALAHPAGRSRTPSHLAALQPADVTPSP